jgi:hypothetical protein
MTQYSIISSFLKNKIVQPQSKSKLIRNDSVFTNTIVRLMDVNADTPTISFFLELYSHYKNIFIQDLNPVDIRAYIELENKLLENKNTIIAYVGGGLHKQNTTPKEISHSLYQSWLTHEKTRFNNFIKGGNEMEEINIHTKDIFYKLGVIYGSLLQFLKDVQVELSGNELSGNDLKITGFVDENNELVSICKLTKYASSVILLIDSSVELFVKNGVLDMKLLKPILSSLGIDLNFIENTYNDAMTCIQEFKNIFQKRNRIIPEENLSCKKENKYD